MKKFLCLLFVLNQLTWANPYPQEKAVPKDPPNIKNSKYKKIESQSMAYQGHNVLRIQIDWNNHGGVESYNLNGLYVEKSGTPGLLKSRLNHPKWGSYLGTLRCHDGKTYYDSIGTGSTYRKLVRALSFRYPLPTTNCEFSLTAENPLTGDMEIVFNQIVAMDKFKTADHIPVEVTPLQRASSSQKIYINIYAEGYALNQKHEFLNHAQKTIKALLDLKFPGVEHFEFNAVFAPSNTKLGSHRHLGQNIPERDSFLGLYYPYWTSDILERWYHVIYPTREEKFRNAIGQVPYDYPIVLVDSSSYWGIGNYKELTAIPAKSTSFAYLLYHELGHYFGLNEEYSGGGPTELAFAEGIFEPWSQNLTFSHPTTGTINRDELKWNKFLFQDVPLPTPVRFWHQHYSPSKTWPVGAYTGGYADSEPRHRAFIPVKPGACLMHSGNKFCPVCHQGILDVVNFDLGQKN